jgi:hypothetical protein
VAKERALNGIWLPFCTRRPGPDWKQGYPGIPKRSLDQIEGEAKHSAEGGRLSMHGVLDSEARLASWTFSVFKSGPPEQHYPLESVVWTNGSPQANLKFIGEEHEGVAGEELNGNQVLWTAQITSSVRKLCPKVAAFPPTRLVNLWEHRELTIFGADPTACPSGRIPWPKIIAAVTVPEEDDMPDWFKESDWKALQQKVTDVYALRFLADTPPMTIRQQPDGKVWLIVWHEDAEGVTPTKHHVQTPATLKLMTSSWNQILPRIEPGEVAAIVEGDPIP